MVYRVELVEVSHTFSAELEAGALEIATRVGYDLSRFEILNSLENVLLSNAVVLRI